MNQLGFRSATRLVQSGARNMSIEQNVTDKRKVEEDRYANEAHAPQTMGKFTHHHLQIYAGAREGRYAVLQEGWKRGS